jgi:hypothetical protein
VYHKYFTVATFSHFATKYDNISVTSSKYHHQLFLKSMMTFLILFFHFNSSIAFLNSFVTQTQKEFIFIEKIFELISSVSKFFTMIFSLIISISNSSPSLSIVSVTLVPVGHLIHEVTSLNELFFVTSFQFTFKIISQDFIQLFSAGLQGIGFTILGFQGAAISTYAQIHSNSQAKLSSKLWFSNGGKYTVCSS